jgi:ribosomal protein S18 acetylase RimI-like enzyme
MGHPQPNGVSVLDAGRSQDTEVVEHLTTLINEVYRTAESGLWRDGVTRTTADEITDLIAAGEMAVTSRGARIVGAVQIHEVAPDVTEFGMLAADPQHRNTGVGRALIDFAEQSARRRGMRAMQLVLLVPREWRHPAKEFLKSWYHRLGYRVVRTAPIDEVRPDLAPLLATACTFDVYQKPLRPVE